MQLYESQIVQHAMDMSYVENDPMNDTQVVQAKSFDKYNFVDKTTVDAEIMKKLSLNTDGQVEIGN